MLPRFKILLTILACMTNMQVYAADKVTYESDVKPILREHCFACHNQDEAKSGLTLDSFDGLTSGGASGEVVAPGDLDGSRLWKLVTHQEEPKMPPGDKLPEEEIKVLQAWITGGLLKDAASQPLKSSKPAVAKIEAEQVGQRVADPAMPEQLFHEPVLWTSQVGPVDAMATSPWAPLLAVAWQRQVSFYHTDSLELLGIIPYVDGVPRVVRFSRDGSLVLVAGGRHAAAGSAALFDVKTGARLATVGDELDIVLAADISPDLSLVAIGGPKKKVRVYRVADRELAYEISKHTDWVTALGFSPDGKFLATADRNGGALLWQASAGHERADLRGHKAAITALDWRADAAMLATASEDGTTRLWNPAGQQIKSIATHQSGVLSVRFAQDGKFVTAGRDQHVKTWNADGGAIADFGKMPGMALAATFTHDWTKVIASDYTGEVRAIDVKSKETIATLPASPKYLFERLADADSILRTAQQNVQTAESQLKTRRATLEEGQAVHATHDAKLAETQSALNKDQSALAALSKLHSQHEQKVAETRQSVEQAKILLAEREQLLAQANAPSDEENATVDDGRSEKLAELQQQVEAAQRDLTTVNQESEQAVAEFATTTQKRQATERSVKTATALLRQVQGESAGLPDLAKLTQQREAAQTAASAAKTELAGAERKKQQLASEQDRLTHANEHFATQVQAHQAEQQDLTKQSGKLEVQHALAAQQLSTHQEQVAELAEQFKSIQTTLAELQSAETKLTKAEQQLAAELAKIRDSLAESEQAVARLEASRQDFDQAEALRKSYSAQQKTTVEQD
ncbi:MAG: c-type cytochrome domain-containing protein [Bythopirellula sp.]